MSQRRRPPYIAVANVPHLSNVETTKRGTIRVRTSLLVQNLGTLGQTRGQGEIVGAKLALRAVAGPLRKDLQEKRFGPSTFRSSDDRQPPFSRDRLGFMTTRKMYPAPLHPYRARLTTSTEYIQCVA
jgi:hypothetical protein